MPISRARALMLNLVRVSFGKVEGGQECTFSVNDLLVNC